MAGQRAKSVSVMLDADITAALKQVQQSVVTKMNQGGVFGLAATPTLGYLARELLRTKLGLQADKKDNATAD